MANAVRVRVELRQSYDSNDAFRRMFAVFKKQCIDVGVMQSYKQHATFESKSRKRRRKKKEAELMQLKTKLKENFLPPGKRGGDGHK